MISSRNELDQIEKDAILALQSILSAREPVTDQQYDAFAMCIDKLPPHRALIVFGHTLNAVSERMGDNDPYKIALKRMGRTITEDMGSDYTELLERDPAFYESQRNLLASNLCDMSDMMRTIAEERKVS